MLRDKAPSPGIPSEAVCDLVQYGSDLTPHQFQAVRELINQLPGRTQLIHHHIRTAPGTKVICSYRIAVCREAIQSKVRHMLDLGVIEPSHSAWSRPVVLVPKPDKESRSRSHTLHSHVDSRNRVSQFTAGAPLAGISLACDDYADYEA
ncbi:hypothetical protein AAFF_G00239760 [Aldrovandia affinis]|uniref:Uncharacterized protein n=1 Tax=Aldrovandia affinis TaxID=143900 RepID=A0AAD7SUM9_9TELE|nr:hypothetical protein AAFF_G00239760 [Aldrovandia affinis]